MLARARPGPVQARVHTTVSRRAIRRPDRQEEGHGSFVSRTQATSTHIVILIENGQEECGCVATAGWRGGFGRVSAFRWSCILSSVR